jgi:hypothetical protein
MNNAEYIEPSATSRWCRDARHYIPSDADVCNPQGPIWSENSGAAAVGAAMTKVSERSQWLAAT